MYSIKEKYSFVIAINQKEFDRKLFLILIVVCDLLLVVFVALTRHVSKPG